MTAIQKFLSDCRDNIGAAEHWYKAAVARGATSEEAWNEGPYPDMKKLVECVTVLSEACEYYIGRSGSRVAQQTLEKVESILKSE